MRKLIFLGPNDKYIVSGKMSESESGVVAQGTCPQFSVTSGMWRYPALTWLSLEHYQVIPHILLLIE